MRILVTGDRNWRNAAIIRVALTFIEYDTPPGSALTLIHGDARGADTIADVIVQLDMATRPDFRDSSDRKWVTIEAYAADWSLGRGAGPIRNQEMLNTGVDYVVGFHNNIEESRGTKDMLRRCAKAGIPGRLFTEEGEVEDWQSLVT